MAFPTLSPNRRQFDPGSYPVKTFTNQSGAERRILYGNKRTGMKLQLRYENITDSQAEEFNTHFDDRFGSYSTFDIPSEAKTGWDGATGTIDAPAPNKWRYATAPSIVQIKKGISSVTVDLIGVL